MSYTRALAKYGAELKYEDLPKEVVEQAKLLTLHTLGVSIAACPTTIGRDVTALGAEIGGEKKESTILGFGSKVSCTRAALVNGTLSDTLDWEDCGWTGHPSANVIPAALAVAEKVRASGKDYITSVAAGYEIYQRIAMAVQPSKEWHFQHGWGLWCWGIFGSAIPAAKLLKANEDEMAVTIGIAAALTPVVHYKIHLSRSEMYHYQYGFTCRDGIASALVAKMGMNGPYDALDEPMGYWGAVSDICDWNWFTKGLGKDYLMMDILMKRWPANMWIQQLLDILDAMIKEEKINPDDVAEIVVNPSLTKERGTRMIYRPEGYLGIHDADDSIPYMLAVIILDQKPGPNWYTEERLKDKKLLEIAGKVKATGPVLDLYDAFKMYQAGEYPEMSVEVVTKDGRKRSKSVHFPKGHPKNRLTHDEHTELFKHAASYVLKPGKAERAAERILRLEEIDDMSEIGKLLHN